MHLATSSPFCREALTLLRREGLNMSKLITSIEGAINTAVGKAKESAHNSALHEEGKNQREQGEKQQEQARETVGDKDTSNPSEG
jgi:sugar/nucleoside kinase (ribokinase family)